MLNHKPLPSKEDIRSRFSYADGFLYLSSDNTLLNPIGHQGKKGYIRISFDGESYMAHRLIWCYFNSDPADLQIDHINRKRSDNRIENLRTVTSLQNNRNTPGKRGAKAKCCGVYWNANRRGWDVTITVNYKLIYLGMSKDFFEACCVRMSANNKYSEIIMGIDF